MFTSVIQWIRTNYAFNLYKNNKIIIIYIKLLRCPCPPLRHSSSGTGQYGSRIGNVPGRVRIGISSSFTAFLPCGTELVLVPDESNFGSFQLRSIGSSLLRLKKVSLLISPQSKTRTCFDVDIFVVSSGNCSWFSKTIQFRSGNCWWLSKNF